MFFYPKYKKTIKILHIRCLGRGHFFFCISWQHRGIPVETHGGASQKIINRLKKSSIVSKNHQSSQKIINRLKKSSIASKTYQTLQKTSNASILNLNLFISEKFILFPIQRIVFYVINNPLIILVPLNNTVVKPGLPAKTGIYF